MTCRKPDNTDAGGYLRDCTRSEPHSNFPMKYTAPRSIDARLGTAFDLRINNSTYNAHFNHFPHDCGSDGCPFFLGWASFQDQLVLNTSFYIPSHQPPCLTWISPLSGLIYLSSKAYVPPRTRTKFCRILKWWMRG